MEELRIERDGYRDKVESQNKNECKKTSNEIEVTFAEVKEQLKT